MNKNDIFKNILITVVLIAIVAVIGLGIWKYLVHVAEERGTIPTASLSIERIIDTTLV